MWISKIIIMFMMIKVIIKWHMDVMHKPSTMMSLALTTMSVLMTVPEPLLDVGVAVPVLWDPIPGSRTC